MKQWKRWLSAAMAVTVAASGFMMPQTAEKASAAETMVTDADLTDGAVAEPASWGVTPNEEQLHYMKEGLAAFCHFGPNTFNNVEWGESYGTRAPSNIFTLSQDFDAETMVKAVKDAGFSRLILTAKHHDGFCIWASDYTTYDIASTNYKNGNGDILEELSDACTKYNLDMGCYLSPWDIHEDHYGCFGDNNNTPNSAGITDYNELYINSIREICTAKKADGSYKYGNNNPNRRSDRFVEWWMDGAIGSGQHQQHYDWIGILGEITKHNPHCQIFGTGGAINGKNGDADKALASTGGVHWIGNESGLAGDETWAKLKKGQDLNKVGSYVNGFPEGDQWSVPEADTKLLANGWFWGPSKQNSLRTMENLADIYFRSVGHGATLLLNLSPNNQGKVDDGQLNRLKEFGETIQNTFRNDLTKAEGVTASASSVWKNAKAYSPSNVLDTIPEGEKYDNTYWAPAEGETTGTLEINFGSAKTFDVVSIEEYIQKGQTIASFSVEYKGINGRWEEFGKGATISSKRLVRNEPVSATAVRIHILDAKSTPMITNVGVFKADEKFEAPASSGVKLPENLKSIPIKEFTTSQTGGTWTFENNDTSAWSNAAKNGVASFQFTGTKFWLKGTVDSSHGKMDIYVDGTKIDTANTKGSPREMGALVYTSPDLAYGAHTVRIVCVEDAIDLSEALYHDGSGIFEMKNKEYEIAEGGTIEVEIIRTGGSSGEVTVAYATPSGGAEQGVNYKFLDDTITFADGETSKKITLTSFNSDRTTDGMDFYFTLMSAENEAKTASVGINSSSRVIIRKMDDTGIKNDARKLLQECEALNLELYKGAGQEKVKALMQELSVYLQNDMIPASAIFNTANELKQAKENLEIRDSYTEEDPFVMPEGTEVKNVEAEFFTLDASHVVEANKYVRIQENTTASNQKEVNWFENGNRIYLPFTAAKAGTYKVTATYRSGRESGSPNCFEWSGTNVTSGSQDVYGPDPNVWKTQVFNIQVTAAGAGQLVFTASSKAGPVIDKFEIECVDKTVVPVSVTGVTLDEAEVTLTEDKAYAIIKVNILPANATNKEVTFVSSDESVVKVDANGVVTAVNNGEAVITVKTADGNKTAECKVKVTDLIIPGDSTELQEKLEAAEKIDLSGYTSESAEQFRQALVRAKEILGNKKATQEQIQEALNTLETAKLALKPIGSVTKPDPKPVPNPEKPAVPAIGKTADIGGVIYTVTKSAAEGGTVAVTRASNKNKKKITIPAVVTIDGYVFGVTSIAKNAFAKNKKLKTIVIGANIKTIGAKSFFKCKKLKNITFKGVNGVKVGANAFKGTAGKPKVTVPKKMKNKKLKALKKNLKKKGRLSQKAVYKKSKK